MLIVDAVEGGFEPKLFVCQPAAKVRFTTEVPKVYSGASVSVARYFVIPGNL